MNGMHIVMTPTGLAFDVSAPDPLAVRLADISRALANIQLAPGRLSRPVCMAEVAVLSTTYLERERHVTDPWVLSCAMLVAAPRAYLPQLDLTDTRLWADRMFQALELLSHTVMHRFGLRETFGRSFRTALAAQMAVSHELVRQLGHSSALATSDGPDRLLTQWKPDLSSAPAGVSNPAQVAALFEARFLDLERARLKAWVTPADRMEAATC